MSQFVPLREAQKHDMGKVTNNGLLNVADAVYLQTIKGFSCISK